VAADIGTGIWTALAQIAAGALDVPLNQVELRIGDSALPPAAGRRRFSGISNWGASILAAADRLRDQLDSQYG
jgi:xanthine dehydrogenase YagR molybdenum-binding subunit